MFPENLKRLRKQRGYSMDLLADIYNKKFEGKMNKSTISRYENGLQEPMYTVVKNLATLFNVSINTLTDDNAVRDVLDTKTQELLTNYNKLNDLGQHEVRKRAAELTELPRYLKAGQNNKIMTVGIDAYEMPASAGSGMFLSDEYKEVIQVKDCYEAHTADFVVPISGDSMEPLYSDGDRVFVKSMPMVEVGEIGIFVINGDAYIKKRGRDRLISLNRKRKDIIFGEGDTIVCLGKVIGKVKD